MEKESKSSRPEPADWNPAPPERVPPPTFWPAGVGLGATLFVWGLVSSLILILAGAVLFLVALGGWIGEMRHGQDSNESPSGPAGGRKL